MIALIAVFHFHFPPVRPNHWFIAQSNGLTLPQGLESGNTLKGFYEHA